MTERRLTPFVAPVAAFALLLGASTTGAQDQQQPAEGDAPAAQCLSDLIQFGQVTAADGFWVGGWGFTPGFGWAAGIDPMVPPTAAPVPPTAATVPPAATAPQGGAVAPPWGDVGLEPSPRYDVRVLYLSAEVFARQGNEEACQFVLAEMQEMYQDYVTRIREAGVEPAMILDWRQEQIALANPVTELPETFTLTVERFIGAEVRNPRDEYLGSVADVIFDRTNQTIQYVVIARGGFLGLGEDLIPVPWEHFSLATGIHTLVLDATAAQIAAAPQAVAGTNGPLFDDVDRYWAG